MKNIFSVLLLSAVSLLNAQNNTPVWKGLFGDLKTIAVCSPGLPGKSQAVDKALKNLRNAGYNVKVMPNARKNENSGKLVSAELRAADFMQAYLDKEVDAVWCTRGGIGAIEMAKLLDWNKLRSRKIPVIGFSNITELHCLMLNNKVGHVFTGPSMTQLIKCNTGSINWFASAISGGKLNAIQLKVIRPGACSGYPAGGHLTFYQRAYCNGNVPASDGKIVFLETPNNPQKLAANELEQLRKKGCFDKCAAVVFGNIKGKKQVIEKIMHEFANKVKCPVFYDFPYGHQNSNFLIDFERKITVSAEGVLQFE